MKLGDVEKGLSGPTEAVTFFGLQWKDANGDIRESIDLLPELLQSIDNLGGAGPRVRHELDALLGGDIARRVLPLLALEAERREELLELAKAGVVNQEAANRLAETHVEDVLRSAEAQARLAEATADWIPTLEKVRDLWHRISLTFSEVLGRVGRELAVMGVGALDLNTPLDVVEDRIAYLQRQIDQVPEQSQIPRNMLAQLAELISLRKDIIVAGSEAFLAAKEAAEKLAEVEIVIPERPDEFATALPHDFFGEERERLVREMAARNRERRRQDAEEEAAENEERARAVAALELRLAESVRLESIKQLNQMQAAWDKVGTSISAIITQSRSWKDVLQNVLGLLVQFGAFLVGGGEGGLRGFFGFPALQYGGPTNPNQPYIVGEAGPELFVPSSSGRIVRNDQLPAGGSGATININATTTMTQAEFDTYLARSLPEVERALGLGEMNG